MKTTKLRGVLLGMTLLGAVAARGAETREFALAVRHPIEFMLQLGLAPEGSAADLSRKLPAGIARIVPVPAKHAVVADGEPAALDALATAIKVFDVPADGLFCVVYRVSLDAQALARALASDTRLDAGGKPMPMPAGNSLSWGLSAARLWPTIAPCELEPPKVAYAARLLDGQSGVGELLYAFQHHGIDYVETTLFSVAVADRPNFRDVSNSRTTWLEPPLFGGGSGSGNGAGRPSPRSSGHGHTSSTSSTPPLPEALVDCHRDPLETLEKRPEATRPLGTVIEWTE